MKVCDCSLWDIWDISHLHTLPLFSLSRACRGCSWLSASVGKVLSHRAPEAGPPVVPGWFSGCPGPPDGGVIPTVLPRKEKRQPSL